MKITNSNLYNNLFSEDDLIENLDNLNINRILNTQKLTPKFCIKYIYCLDNNDSGSEDAYLYDISHILRCQPHIKKQDLLDVLNSKNNK
jgi:hypothetical protein